VFVTCDSGAFPLGVNDQQAKGSDMTTWITICDTCKRDDWNAETATQTDGETLAALVEAANSDGADVKTRRVSCLMGCKHGCNVAIQANGKLNYTLGDFEPDADSAAAIVEYAQKHSASETGQVPFREWPQGVKGHFVTRHQPIPE
jgi:predicted metal-binding protein